MYAVRFICAGWRDAGIVGGYTAQDYKSRKECAMHYFNRTLRALLCVVLAAGLCLPAGLAFAEESASDTLPADDDRPAPETDEGSEPDQESVQPQESGSQDPQV